MDTDSMIDLESDKEMRQHRKASPRFFATFAPLRASVNEVHEILEDSIRKFDNKILFRMSIDNLEETLASLIATQNRLSEFIAKKRATVPDSPQNVLSCLSDLRSSAPKEYREVEMEDKSRSPTANMHQRNPAQRKTPIKPTKYRTKTVTGKRPHDGNGDIAPWPKKSKERHKISHFGPEAEFLEPPTEIDIEAEVDRRLSEIEALRTWSKRFETERLANKDKKRRDLSEDLAENGLPQPRPKLEPRKRLKTTTFQKE